MMLTPKQSIQVYYVLRAAVAMCFIGHGAFGIITKEIWCNYFGVFGMGHEMSYQLMPIVGSMDILLGMLMIFYPIKAIPAWLLIWGFATAMLRPLSGEPFAEFIERAGNYGAPLALLILTGFPKNFKALFTPVLPSGIHADKTTLKNLSLCLRIVVFLLLSGHGWLNVIEKKGLLDQYVSLGFANPVATAKAIGIAEIVAAVAVLIKPLRSFLLLFFVWKMCSELFYSRYELFEWIERGGSYGAILALWLVTEKEAGIKWPFGKNVKQASLQ